MTLPRVDGWALITAYQKLPLFSGWKFCAGGRVDNVKLKPWLGKAGCFAALLLG